MNLGSMPIYATHPMVSTKTAICVNDYFSKMKGKRVSAHSIKAYLLEEQWQPERVFIRHMAWLG